MTYSSNPKVAVIGAGFWGKNLVRNFAGLGALALVCDPNPGAAGLALKNDWEFETCPSVAEVLGNRDITAVAISTPAATHYSLAKEALQAGKDVFVEKPLALQVAEGEELVELAQKEGRILMVGHILQYHPAVQQLKTLVDAGELGKIQYVYSDRLNIGKIRSEENILWSFAPHDISVMLTLLGEMPTEVFAHGGQYLQSHVADITLTFLSFASGVKGHIFVSWLHPFKEQMLVVVGDRKMAVFNDVSLDKKLVLYPHRIDWIDRLPVARKADGEVVPVDHSEPLREECAHFLTCLRSRQNPRTDGWEGLRVLRVLEACQFSLDQHGASVRVAHEDKVAEPYFVHDTAVIDKPGEIGAGTKIWHFSHILKNCRIGGDCNIGQNVVIGPDVVIGRGCKIQNNVSIYKGVTLEEYVFCGPSLVFTNVVNPRAHIKRMDELKPTLIRTGATLGANATIVCGHTVGRYAFVGAGAVVTRDVPDYALVIGNPARHVGWMCACGIKLTEALTCGACGLKYSQGEVGLKPEG